MHSSPAILSMQAPGELVEVLAEKVLLAAQDLLETTAELKRRAFLAQAGKQAAKADRAQTHADMSARIQSLESELAEAEEVSCSVLHTLPFTLHQDPSL
jgi:hypothetical protein